MAKPIKRNYGTVKSTSQREFDKLETSFFNEGTLTELQANIRDLYELVFSLNERLKVLEVP